MAIIIRLSSGRAGIDQGDLQVVLLERIDDRAGIEPEYLRQVGARGRATAGVPRRRAVRDRRACSGPGRPRPRDQVAAQGGDPFEQVPPPLDAVERAGVRATVLMHQEVRVGGLQQGVVLRRLDVEVAGIEDLPRHQRLEDGLGGGDDPVQGRPAVEESSCLGAVMTPLLKSGPPPSWRR